LGAEIMNTALLRRRLAYAFMRLGLPGVFGLALLLGAAGYALAILLPTVAQVDKLDQRIADATIKLQTAKDARAAAPLTPTEQLLAFYQAFPKGATVPDLLGKIYAIAGEQKLSLEIGEYVLTKSRSGRLDQFRITFPVKGSYPQIRKFVGAALATAPALALESIQMKRDKVGDGVADARIVFLLYLEKGA
jgi:hypothetical protein